MSEVRIMREGSLRWVQGSGSGTSWATASAPASGVVGYVDSFSFTSALQVATQMDRGTPTHHKITQFDAPSVTFQYRWTGSAMPHAATASGSTVPMVHLEYRASAVEKGAASAWFYQFHGAVRTQIQFTENTDGTTISETYALLGLNGPTASGYLS